MSFRFIKDALIDLVFPATCLRCHRGTARPDPPFCLQCMAELDSERAKEACPRCAASVAPFEVDDAQCGKCRRRSSNVFRTVRVAPYGRLVADILLAYKYRKRDELEPILGRWLVEAAAGSSWFDRVEAIVAVPTHWTRKLALRRYPAAALAEFVAGHTGIPNLSLLHRVRAGRHQVGLSYAQRLTNVRGAFALRSGIEMNAPGLLLIDDVMTTGATMEECARTLRRGGAGKIFAAVVVRVSAEPNTPLPRI